MKTKINFNSSINQDIKRQFVQRDVLTCFSYEMDEILKEELIKYDDIENLTDYICPACGEAFNTPEEFQQITDDNGRSYGENPYICPSCKEEVKENDIELQNKEIFEWWIVSSYLYNKLKEKGEVVTEWGNNFYWGRCTTGQGILLDGVISSICYDMEILEGQTFSWAK